MPSLKGSQKRYLRGLANSLKPTVQIGKSGLTFDVLKAIETAIDSHELIKVRFLEFKEEKKVLSQKIVQETGCELVGMVGHVALLYRQQKDDQKRKINLPGKSE